MGLAIKRSKRVDLVDGLAIKEEYYKMVKTCCSSFFATNPHSFFRLREQRIGVWFSFLQLSPIENCANSESIFQVICGN